LASLVNQAGNDFLLPDPAMNRRAGEKADFTACVETLDFQFAL
jgi:hypothetical protein